MKLHVRSVGVGIAIGIATLLLLDLARILGISVGQGETSAWYPVACYAAAGLVIGVGVASGRRDRLIPLLAAIVVALVALPVVPAETGWFPDLPIVPSTAPSQAVAFVAVGAYVWGVLRGAQGKKKKTTSTPAA